MKRTRYGLSTAAFLALTAYGTAALAAGPRMEGKYWVVEVQSCEFHSYLEWNDKGSKGYYRPEREGNVYLVITLMRQNKGNEKHALCSFQFNVKTDGGVRVYPVGDVNPLSGPFVSKRYWRRIIGEPKDRFRQTRFIFEVPRRSNTYELSFQEFKKEALTVDLKPLLPAAK